MNQDNFAFLVFVTSVILWVTTIIHDAQACVTWLLLTDIFIVPFGILRGLYLVITGA